jgi:hypothetical protein
LEEHEEMMTMTSAAPEEDEPGFETDVNELDHAKDSGSEHTLEEEPGKTEAEDMDTHRKMRLKTGKREGISNPPSWVERRVRLSAATAVSERRTYFGPSSRGDERSVDLAGAAVSVSASLDPCEACCDVTNSYLGVSTLTSG